MKPETVEWVAKADADLDTANREVVVTYSPNYDAVCFHAQQCAEKYLKAERVWQRKIIKNPEFQS